VTILVGSYTDFEQELIVSAYFCSNKLGKESVALVEIAEYFDIGSNARWVRNAIADYWSNGLSKEQRHSGSTSAQRIWLTSDGLRRAETLIQNGVSPKPHDHAQLEVVDSSRWTGLPRNGNLSDSNVLRLKSVLQRVDHAVEASNATNADKSQARAYVLAITSLADAPEPPADLIWLLINRASNLAGIAAFFVSLAALFQVTAS